MDPKKQRYRDGNAKQAIALDDTFSLERYRQFAGHLPAGPLRILDVGCAEGRGGAELHRVRPDVELSGLDCVAERLAKLPSCYLGRIEGMTQEIPVEDRSFDAVVPVSSSNTFTRRTWTPPYVSSNGSSRSEVPFS